MAKIMDPILTILSILGHWSILLGSFGGPGRCYLHAWSLRLKVKCRHLAVDHMVGLYPTCLPDMKHCLKPHQELKHMLRCSEELPVEL